MTAYDCHLSARLAHMARSGWSPGAPTEQLESTPEYIVDAPKAGRFLFHFESLSVAAHVGRIDHYVVVDVGRTADGVVFTWFVDQGTVERHHGPGRTQRLRWNSDGRIWQLGRPRAVTLTRVDEALAFPLVPLPHSPFSSARPK